MISDINAMAEFLLSHDDYAVITHFRPDGDAYGCALAGVYLLEALGKRAFPVCDDEVEPKFRFLEGWERFVKPEDEFPFKPLTALGVDVGDLGRMGRASSVFEACEAKAVIDHHATNVGFGDITLLDANAAAAGEIMVRLAERLNVKITKPMAEQLYTAIVTDSGNFQFRDTRPETLELSAKLLKCGADVEYLSRKLFRTRSLARTRLLGAALNQIVMSDDGSVAGVMITDEMFERCHADRPDSHSIVNYLNEIEGVRVGFSCEQRHDPYEVKISFRSGDGTDVSKLAERFNGGGHVAASGGKIPNGRLEDEFANIMRGIIEYLDEVK